MIDAGGGAVVASTMGDATAMLASGAKHRVSAHNASTGISPHASLFSAVAHWALSVFDRALGFRSQTSGPDST
jgi:hypothetical protein